LKILKKTYIIFLLILLGGLNAYSYYSDNFVRCSDSEFKYSLLVPENWKRVNYNLQYKHILLLEKDPYTTIKVTASKALQKEKEKWKNWSDWYIQGMGYDLKEIIDTNSLQDENNLVQKILIFEYTYRQKKIMQKVYLCELNDMMVAIECRTRKNFFYQLNKTFNTVIHSLSAE